MTNYIGKQVKHRFFGEGVIISIDKEKGRMKVDFDGDVREFRYPEAIQQYFTLVPDKTTKPQTQKKFNKTPESKRNKNPEKKVEKSQVEQKQPIHEEVIPEPVSKTAADIMEVMVPIGQSESDVNQGGSDVTEKKKKLKNLWRVAITAAIVIVIVAAGVIIKSIKIKQQNEQLYQQFLEKKSTVRVEQLGYKDTYSIWNEEQGNDINTLLGGGYFCDKGSYLIKSTVNRENGTQIFKEGKKYATLKDSVSYINVVDNKLFYRKNKDRKIYSYDLSIKKEVLLIDVLAGAVQVIDDQLYYVDYSNGYGLMHVGLDGKSPSKVIETAVREFVVLGDQIVFLDGENQLRLKDIHTTEETVLTDAVERFFINESIFIERGNNIYEILTHDLENAKQLISADSEDDELNLCGAYEGGIYYQKNGMLYDFDGIRSNKIVEEEHLLYTSICNIDNKIYYVSW